MSSFELYLSMGWKHILDIAGYDHILYIIALIAIYPLSKWKQILVLITAFTIGHSITLALSVLDIVTVQAKYIEFLIASTIVLTAAWNFFLYVKGLADKEKSYTQRYLTALVFGCIHGMGFSFLLKSLLGKSQTIIGPLLSFNIGLELGQVLIVALLLTILFVSKRFFNLKHKTWVYLLSGLVLILAVPIWIDKIQALIS